MTSTPHEPGASQDPLRSLRIALLCASMLVPLLGLVVELAHHTGGGTDSPLVPLFSLSEEGNVPTWYSSALLLGCGACLLAITAVVRRQGGAFVRRWGLLGLLFLFLSLDETAQFHERLNGLFHLRGALYFGWILPVGAALVPLGLAYLRFLLHLPPPIRWRVVLAGVLYVGGALGMEVPLGIYADRHGTDTLGYVLIDLIEETLEVWGATLFLLTLLRYLVALTRPPSGGAP